MTKPSFIRQAGSVFVFFVLNEKKLTYYYKEKGMIKEGKVLFENVPAQQEIDDKVAEIMSSIAI